MPDPLADLAQLVGVPSAVAAANAAVDAVLRDRGLRAVSEERRGQALAAGAEASAALTGDRDRWLLGSLRLSTELGALASLIRSAPAQALARAHALLARGRLGDDELGRIRGGAEVGRRMQGVGDLLTRPTTAPAIVLGAVVHAELATVAPFGDASGLVARAAEHLVLISAGLDPLGVIVVEAGHLADAANYHAGLHRYADGGVAGVAGWIIQCAAAVSRGAEVSPVVRGPTG
jgi:hypothetical protein